MTDDSDNYPRALPLTPEQLRRAYSERGWSDIYDRLAETRLAMLRAAEKHNEKETSDVG